MSSHLELVRFIGIMVAMTLQQQRECREYWREAEGGLFPQLSFGLLLGMSCRSLEDILRALTLYPKDAASWDPWCEVRHFVNCINHSQAECFMPGDTICINELSSKWTGLGDWYDLGLPHITKCKPNLGILLWSSRMLCARAPRSC